MFNRTFASALIAAAIAVGSLAATVQPSAAKSHHHHNHGGIGLGVAGFLLGAALAEPRPVYVDDYDDDSWHIRRCYDRYQSYDRYSDSYMGYDGYRHYCRL